MYRLLPYRRDLAENQCSVDRRGRRVRALVFLGIRPACCVDGMLVVGCGGLAVAVRHALIQAAAATSVLHDMTVLAAALGLPFNAAAGGNDGIAVLAGCASDAAQPQGACHPPVFDAGA